MALKTYTKAEMKAILEKHQKWLQGDPKGERADLSGSNLSGSDLSRSDLSWSNLSRSDLSWSNLSGSRGSELVIAKSRILPEGDLIGYKKCSGGAIVKLSIPADAKRSSAFGRKCRAEYAKVLSIVNRDGKPVEEAQSSHDDAFKYHVGDTVKPTEGFDENWQEECAAGIHFFITREEAVAY